jgi:D-alanine-D-alanine ligase-like ATP-grasp enzyme
MDKELPDKEPPKLSKEYKELLNNTKYMGGIAPLHFTIIKDQNVCRVDFIVPALDPLNNAYVVAGINGYAVLGKKELGEIAEAAKNAYEGLK